jgi:hypothetical protein
MEAAMSDPYPEQRLTHEELARRIAALEGQKAAPQSAAATAQQLPYSVGPLLPQLSSATAQPLTYGPSAATAQQLPYTAAQPLTYGPGVATAQQWPYTAQRPAAPSVPQPVGVLVPALVRLPDGQETRMYVVYGGEHAADLAALGWWCQQYGVAGCLLATSWPRRESGRAYGQYGYGPPNDYPRSDYPRYGRGYRGRY